MDITEEYAFTLILHSGNAKSSAYEALALVKEKNFIEASIKMEEAKIELSLAKNHHAKLLRELASNNKIDVNVLLLHAEGHLTSAQMSVEMVKELEEVYKMFERMSGA